MPFKVPALQVGTAGGRLPPQSTKALCIAQHAANQKTTIRGLGSRELCFSYFFGGEGGGSLRVCPED